MEYDALLERAYARIPEKVFSKERFDIPTFDSFVEGNRTIIKNFDAIAETLRRDPSLIIKYLSRELAVPMTHDGGRLVLQGRFRDKMLNEKLKQFTETYVLCKMCKKPDTHIQEMERGVKLLICEACGAKAPIHK